MIGAVVLAAGLSTRMGSPKMLLKWGSTTVIEHVVESLNQAGVDEVIVVAGALFEEIKKLLDKRDVIVVVNPNYGNGEMTDSLQTGLSELSKSTTAAMIVLGDQPFISPKTMRMLIEAFEKSPHNIIMPSINNRRGHPWIIRRILWDEIMELQAPLTMRDFMRSNQEDIHYVLVEDENIVKDMDTPEDYRRMQPKKER
jgi:molybdenum cofactor cytidylyltransferase